MAVVPTIDTTGAVGVEAKANLRWGVMGVTQRDAQPEPEPHLRKSGLRLGLGKSGGPGGEGRTGEYALCLLDAFAEPAKTAQPDAAQQPR